MYQVEKDAIRIAVRERYTQAVENSCRGPGCCSAPEADRSLEMGYSPDEMRAAPEGANLGLGCGNPRAIASLRTGEVVVDLGSGAGFDCFLAAGQVGPEGHVIGVDMTPAMITKARANAQQHGYTSVEFRLGEIENLPVADSTADVLLSNCVINLSPDKPRVFAEAFRVLKPGGRLAISDIVARAEMPAHLKADMTLYTCCVAGASLIGDLRAILEAVGFTRIEITPQEESAAFIRTLAPTEVAITDYIVSATITAVKPLG
ncbi:arsenite methyltransferase [Desulfobulbus alkaliphilus]|uniref:arsenite methyltransferase n=1 Tax=Desulfobulbus alkaliphilus TaxID=869814 RepID=UPI001962E831|nr:arsenite methyltransferase [Desulfobulbus alkaliphilus]MBM9535623.1 arsenite methyltransferase [Desulfobulbus alkaliphilus]